ncbi:cytochrome b561 and DOMON domain-containing protein [Trifolium repens]|nr:cytochrome b561 and DOMON domain-containing protein [Trifolium repens]
MKAPLQLLFVITFLGSFLRARPDTDSCTSIQNLKAPTPFDTTNLRCLSVWDAQSFILRYVQTSTNIWSFILSTPDTNSYIAIGFSASGSMVGSSAIVGWVASRGASGGIKQYYLGGVTPNQLETTEPLSWLILATGSTGLFPAAPNYSLSKHLDKFSTRIDYSKANNGSSQVNGNSSSQGDGNSSQGDSCDSKLNLSVPLNFDTTKLNCLSVWNAQGYILRYSQTSSNIWSFILSAPNQNSYISIGFSPNGGMVGSSAIVGWISSNGAIGGMKQYYLAGYAPNQVVPDRGNLQIINNSTLITSQSSHLYMIFQLQTNQPLSRLIYAVGPNGVFPTVPSFALMQHQDKVSVTVNYATGSSVLGNSYMNLKRSHGVLNILGWGMFIIMGAIVARYFKDWDPFWFNFHASVQSLGFILGLIGVISGLILNNQLHVNFNLHKALGIIILVLACLQVMAFVARPKKESKVRKHWNLYHHNIGRIVIILAIANIFYGIHLGKEGSEWVVAYGVVLAILLSIAVIFEIRLWSKD